MPVLTEEIHRLKTALHTELQRLRREGNPRALVRVEIPLSGVAPLAWLRRQSSPVRLYWQSRDKSLEVAAIGAAHSIASDQGMSFSEALDTIHRNIGRSDKPLRYYGGAAFDPTHAASAAWGALGAFRFLLPRFEVVRQADQAVFAVHLCWEDNRRFEQEARCVEEEYEALRFDEADAGSEVQPGIDDLSVEQVAIEPEKDAWCERVRQVLSELGRDAKKLVLACRRSLQLSRDVDGVALLAHLRTRSPEAYQFLFQWDRNAFLGSSPECLYRREGREVYTEAVAGTCRREEDGVSGEEVGRILLNCPKEIAEHDYVVTDLRSALEAVCTRVEMSEGKEVVPWNRLYHLRTRFSGTLAEGCSDCAVIRSLHPSAAVLGYPRSRAWEMLAGVERFNRGWYAGPVGWIGREGAEFAVAIRSALVRGKSLDVFAGAGIVAGSQPQREWEEVKSKMGLFLEAFGLDSASEMERCGKGAESVGKP